MVRRTLLTTARMRVTHWSHQVLDDLDVPLGIEMTVPNAARMYNYYLLRHEALRYRVGVRDPRRQAVAAV